MPPIIVTGRHLSPASLEEIRSRMEKLLCHGNHVIRIRLDLHEDELRHGKTYHIARAIVERRGPSLVVIKSSEDLFKSVSLVIEKLDRMLADNVHREEDKRRHPHAVELPVALPKCG
jgi:putative sigma-54 modulation protein